MIRQEIFEETITLVFYHVASMEGAISHMTTILDDILARLGKMEAPEQQKPTTQDTLTEAVNTLRGNVNVLEEDPTVEPK